jgi:hypothetical protein
VGGGVVPGNVLTGSFVNNNYELRMGIDNKSNALILAGLSLANKFLQNENASSTNAEDESAMQDMLQSIEEVLES